MPPTGAQLAELADTSAVADDLFGWSVAISGTTTVVGEPTNNFGGEPTEGAGAGRVFVFTKTDAGWDETDELKGPDSIAGDAFGYSVAVSGTTVVVGAPYHASGTGRAYVFTKTSAGWDETELEGSGIALATSSEARSLSLAPQSWRALLPAARSLAGRSCSPRPPRAGANPPN